jgi:hypothetical protein
VIDVGRARRTASRSARRPERRSRGRDFKTTLIYADYMPAKREAELVDLAFEPVTNPVTKLSETDVTSDDPSHAGMRAHD